MFQHEELVDSSWIAANSAKCFSCGYFAYDQLDTLRYRLYSGWIPGILMLHLFLLICFTLALYRNETINYLILTLLCEDCELLAQACP
uniref:TLC domain-containing protein n=1 Tax=Aegilops tauschii subsp. strangulata TaxID=200361 RepID=A0A453G0H5_AEGTS